MGSVKRYIEWDEKERKKGQKDEKRMRANLKYEKPKVRNPNWENPHWETMKVRYHPHKPPAWYFSFSIFFDLFGLCWSLLTFLFDLAECVFNNFSVFRLLLRLKLVFFSNIHLTARRPFIRKSNFVLWIWKPCHYIRDPICYNITVFLFLFCSLTDPLYDRIYFSLCSPEGGDL